MNSLFEEIAFSVRKPCGLACDNPTSPTLPSSPIPSPEKVYICFCQTLKDSVPQVFSVVVNSLTSRFLIIWSKFQAYTQITVMPRVPQRRLTPFPRPLEWSQRLRNLLSPHGSKQIFFFSTVSMKVLWESQFYVVVRVLVATPHP